MTFENYLNIGQILVSVVLVVVILLLAGLLAGMVNADLLCLLSTVPGVFDGDPEDPATAAPPPPGRRRCRPGVAVENLRFGHRFSVAASVRGLESVSLGPSYVPLQSGSWPSALRSSRR